MTINRQIRSVLIYEFLTAGGCWSLGDEPPAGSLLAEGAAMRDALACDFAAISEVAEVHLLRDVRLPQPQIPRQVLHPVRNSREELQTLVAIAAKVDAAIIIAPEFSQLLTERVQRVEAGAGPLISSGFAVVQLCSDKQRTCEHLASHRVPTPQGLSFNPQSLPSFDQRFFPAVLKPADGAGSQSMRRIDTPAEIRECDLSAAESWRLERFCPGTPVSVSLLAGPRGFLVLQPCSQILSDDGRFQYRGGSTPISTTLAQRAQRLALAAANTLPPTRGYLGIDIVLGSVENGSEDFVIEINPRLTTSYLGLRQACEQNLAEAMWKWANGEPVSLTYRDRSFAFSPSAFSADITCPENS